MDENADVRKKSPKINSISWGHMDVDGIGKGKDFKLYPGGASEWDWNVSNTKHTPGIQLMDVEELIRHESEYIVLSKGMKNQLEISKEVREHLENVKGSSSIKEYYIKTTEEAVEIYNKLANGNKRVGALIHSTC
ncbi:unnamed protein product [Didymodactylos carnosus]|uniref:Mth938 domain-containing protein n=1 Tax=Didymodactylos carnosus TaxID=1234261 RepID=A0A814EPU1_9BILA|nr:unnamed protein product [Didymodactylos carnosus]CAF1585930.1 unnamed protein product [Didymodactylos carnosus]CAF3745382.1 unnamed protein product [Didymodactylos carnosus]CAF4387405.1 unnamed protein product [Didymodactylos carnosus]